MVPDTFAAPSVDAEGRQLTRTLPLGQGQQNGATMDEIVAWSADQPDLTEYFGYDDAGREVLHLTFEGRLIQSVYDDTAQGGGRLVAQKFFDNLTQYAGGEGTPARSVTYSYDAFGNTVGQTIA